MGWVVDTSTSSVELQNDEECDATKLIVALKLVTKNKSLKPWRLSYKKEIFQTPL
jgi:hypothetical protein